ncbi:MAG TPA: hypothetical protein VJ843_06005 [Candidatus Saccharimonadales bacterium]|nr:hypothetical protein [Candidatus Saccharimonadales bacterium]
MPATKNAPRILFSNANLAETANLASAPHRPILSPRAVGTFATRVGADGVDWQPFYPTYPASAQAFARAVAAGHIKDFALHQSFNNESQHAGAAGLRHRVLASKLGQKLMLPSVADSANFMADIQQRTDRHVPIVYFPRESDELDRQIRENGKGSMDLFQPKAAHLSMWEARTAKDLGEAMDERDYKACLDTHHAQGGGMFDTLLTASASRARAVHLAVARYDVPYAEVDIPGDLAIARSGTYTGPIGAAFDAVDEQGSLEYVVVEAPVSGIAYATGYTALRDIAQVYTELVDGVRERYA